MEATWNYKSWFRTTNYIRTCINTSEIGNYVTNKRYSSTDEIDNTVLRNLTQRITIWARRIHSRFEIIGNYEESNPGVYSNDKIKKIVDYVL